MLNLTPTLHRKKKYCEKLYNKTIKAMKIENYVVFCGTCTCNLTAVILKYYLLLLYMDTTDMMFFM